MFEILVLIGAMIVIAIMIIYMDWYPTRPIKKAPVSYCYNCGCAVTKKWRASKVFFDTENGLAYQTLHMYWACPKWEYGEPHYNLNAHIQETIRVDQKGCS